MKKSDDPAGAANLDFVDELYADYLRNPASVSEEWRQYFARLEGDAPPSHAPALPAAAGAKKSIATPAAGAPPPPKPASALAPTGRTGDEQLALLQHRVERLVRAYRGRGHIQAHLDPLSTKPRYVPELDPQYYGFTEEDLDREFYCETIKTEGRLTLRQISSRLREIYCGAVAFQYLHIDDMRMRHWLQERIEGEKYWEPLPRGIQRRILTRLTDAVVFEHFVRKKFVGAKSFSLEGGESLIPLLDLAIGTAANYGVREIVLGMAHRGRLNVLANIIGKNPREIFREFEDKDPDLYIGGGDVKYHMGYSSDYRTAAGQHVHLSLCFNPSHLEFVNPVVLGRARAKQDRLRDDERAQVMAVLIHGDAAFIGEGVVQETLNLSRLKGYHVGGTIHILVNNQIGFTTPPSDGRSTMYATSVAKMLPAPIMHVNGEDPEAVARCIQLAMDFRQTFKQDVVIDMYCYRRLGHNEGDEPSFTQPLMYALIEKRKSVRDAYLEKLIQMGGVTQELADQIEKKRTEALEQQLNEARRSTRIMPPSSLAGRWKGYTGGPEPQDDDPDTGLSRDTLGTLMERLTDLPEEFHLHPKLVRVMEQRRAMGRGEQPLDWAAGETLAYASLAADGVRIRLSGQDCGRGTFSHRHAVLYDTTNGLPYIPLQHLAGNQAPVDIFNSPLSEVGVLGFDYGFSLDCPEALTLWEAQFGDFANVAQVIIDQFICSGEDKWRRLSGLTMLLPHGFEGAGPEHSSGRIERFLTLAADDNIQVTVPTTPAQIFHLLRRQALRRWRKPLIVFTPKSMLRNPRAVSSLDELTQGRFQRIIPDPRHPAMDQVRQVVLCTGKFYYELEARREKLGITDMAIVRIEQLYPFPKAEIEALLGDCKPGTNVIWVQEEPENMGAWRYLRVTVSMQFLGRLPFSGICRPASASPATGSASAHQIEQEEILAKVFAVEQPAVRPRTETIVGTKQMAV